MTIEFMLLADTRCGIAEGPVWDDRRKLLFFVDILAPAVHAVRLDESDLRSWKMPSRTGSIGLGESGRLIVAPAVRIGGRNADGDDHRQPDQQGRPQESA